MADIIDLANDLAEAERQNKLRDMRRQQGRGPALAFCEECEEPIPEARRLAVPGCRLCVACQAATEK